MIGGYRCQNLPELKPDVTWLGILHGIYCIERDHQVVGIPMGGDILKPD
jgi:hypothetical protein